MTTIIKIEWHDNESAIKEEHKEELSEHAFCILSEKLQDGYMYHELYHVTEDGTHYNGFFEVND